MESVTKEKYKLVLFLTNSKLGKVVVLLIIFGLILGYKYIYMEAKDAPEDISQVTKTPQVIQITDPDPATEKKLHDIKGSIQIQKGSLNTLKQSLDVELEADLDLRLESSVF